MDNEADKAPGATFLLGLMVPHDSEFAYVQFHRIDGVVNVTADTQFTYLHGTPQNEGDEQPRLASPRSMVATCRRIDN